MFGAWCNWQTVKPRWEDQQLPLLLSPLSDTQVYAQEESTPSPTPNPQQLVIEEIREVFGKNADDAIKVFSCESGLKSKCNDGLNKNGSVDCGVGQINTVHGINRKWLLKPEINIRVAKQLFDEQGWNPWRSSNNCHHMLG